MSEITIIFIYLRPKQNGAFNEKQRTKMGVYVKNINNLSQTFGEMKYFATLSLSLSLSSHRPYLASKYLILNSFTKSLSLFFVQFFVPLSFLIHAFIRTCSYVPCRYVRRTLFVSEQILI